MPAPTLHELTQSRKRNESRVKAEKRGGYSSPFSVGYFGQNVYGKSDEEKSAARKRAGARTELSRRSAENQREADKKRLQQKYEQKRKSIKSGGGNAFLGHLGFNRQKRKASGQAATKLSSGATFADLAKMLQGK